MTVKDQSGIPINIKEIGMRALKLLAYKHRVLEQESKSFGRLFSNALSNKQSRDIHPRNFNAPSRE